MAKKKTYAAAPEIPPEQAVLYEAILQVQAGTLTVSEAARRLGYSRNHFQTLMHRGLAALVQAISPQPPGRPAKPEREAQLEEELAATRRELSRLQTGQEISERLMKLAGEVIRGERTLKLKKPKKVDDEGGGGDPSQRLAAVRAMRAGGVSAPQAATLVGAASSTVRRWAARHRTGEPPRRRRGPCRRQATPEEQAQIDALVRATAGQIGADALSRAVPGVSRRIAAAAKREVCRRMEQERVERCTRIRVTVPGVLRGFDQIEERAPASFGYLLRSADGSAPYTTSLTLAERYDARAVLEALERDWDLHEPPYVLRLDRASAHLVEEIRDLAEGYGVLLLHGPAYYPRFYGQLEHGNRPIRAVLDALGASTAAAVAGQVDTVRRILNEQWPRRSLGFLTPAQVWAARPRLTEDRSALRAEVADRAERLRWVKGVRGGPADLTERLAIEAALTARGWLSREPGGWC